MIVALLLIIINVYIYINTKESGKVKEIREKYRILREHIKTTGHEEFDILRHEIPLTMYHRTNGHIGYNTNKGNEIGLCLDGNTNEIFHVLIHELAHSTVDDYSHNKEYWANFKKLRDMCVQLGIYKEIPNKTQFCGKHVQDK